MTRLLLLNTSDVAIQLFGPLRMDHGSHYSLLVAPEQAGPIIDDCRDKLLWTHTGGYTISADHRRKGLA
jgi:hypothetical protein